MKIRLTVDVEYEPNGEDADTLHMMLEEMVNREVANGGITGDTAAYIVSCQFSLTHEPND